jgi:arylsulfatase A-like enzyme
LDEAVGRILDQLKASALEQDTLVFFFGDNGGHPELRSENTPLRDYKWNLFEGGIRVPFLARYPTKWSAGRDFTQPVSALDILPTCLAAAGVPAPAGLDGVDLTPFIRGDKLEAPHEHLYFSIAKQAAIRAGKWKYVRDQQGGQHLFDVETDVSESKDLAKTNPGMLAKLTALAAQAHAPVREGTFTRTDRHQRDQRAKFGQHDDAAAPAGNAKGRKKSAAAEPGAIAK